MPNKGARSLGGASSGARFGLRVAGRVGAEPEHAEDQVEDVVLGVDRDEAEDRLVVADDEAPDRDDDVDGAEGEGVGPRGACSGGEGEQAEGAAGDVDEVVPGVDVEDAEHRVDVARAAEGSAV